MWQVENEDDIFHSRQNRVKLSQRDIREMDVIVIKYPHANELWPLHRIAQDPPTIHKVSSSTDEETELEGKGTV